MSNFAPSHKTMTSSLYPIPIHKNSTVKKPDRIINKRPLNSSLIDVNTTKRIKALNSGDSRSSPQLLQQLMAASAPSNASSSRNRSLKDDQLTNEFRIKSEIRKWDLESSSIPNHHTMTSTATRQSAGGGSCSSGGGVTDSVSNSVLKNLLVSGCDVSAGYICIIPVRSKKTLKT